MIRRVLAVGSLIPDKFPGIGSSLRPIEGLGASITLGLMMVRTASSTGNGWLNVIDYDEELSARCVRWLSLRWTKTRLTKLIPKRSTLLDASDAAVPLVTRMENDLLFVTNSIPLAPSMEKLAASLVPK